MERKRIGEITRIFLDSPGYLEQTGWFRSIECGEPVDVDGRPIPWITYPALDFLSGRVRPEMAVFEYGSGNSTLWWQTRVQHLVSCEHDKEWYAEFKPRVSEKTNYLLRRCKGGSEDYVGEVAGYRSVFNILVLDGRQRVRCARNGIAALCGDGVVVWDNTDRQRYGLGYALLHSAGFKRLDFWGIGPLSTRRWCTSVFYRPDNCLDI